MSGTITVEPVTFETVLTTSTIEITVNDDTSAEITSVGIQGLAGPNTVTTSTTTNITGLLKGNGSVISAAVAGTDYSVYSSSTFATDFAAANLANLGTRSYNDLQNLPTIPTQYWSRTIDGARSFMTPVNAADQFVIGPVTDLDVFAPATDSKFIYTANSETNFGLLTSHGVPSFLNGGAAFGFAKSRGTAMSPTAVQAGDMICGLMPLGYDGTSYSIYGGGRVLPGLWVMVMDVATGDVGQQWELLGGVGGSSAGVIRLNTDNQIGFYGATPVAQSTGWSAGTYSALKSFDPDTATFHEGMRVLATLIDTLKTPGLLGA